MRSWSRGMCEGVASLLGIAGAIAMEGTAEADIITFMGTDADGSLVNALAAFNDFVATADALDVLDFEDTAEGTYTQLVFPGVTLTSSGNFDVFDGPTKSGAFPISGSRHIGNDLLANDIIFTFGAPITAFGFFATDLDNEDVIIQFDNGAPQEFMIPDVGVNGSDAFFGFVDTDSSTSQVVISDTGFLVTYDDVSYATIPAPGVLPLLGLAGLMGTRRRRR